VGTSLNNLGYLAYLAQEYTEAKEHLSESLSIQRQIGDRYHIANCLCNLGAVAAALEEHVEAADHLYEALISARQIKATPLILEVLAEIGALFIAYVPEERERGIELLAFVLHHPLTDRWTRDRTESRLARLAPDLETEVLAQTLDGSPEESLAAVLAEILSRKDVLAKVV
jgi:tetratricopeptide (TPR) repeat protein